MVLPVAGAAVGAARAAGVAAKGARAAKGAAQAARTAAKGAQSGTVRTAASGGRTAQSAGAASNVRNAEVRYQERVKDLSTQGHIKARTDARTHPGTRRHAPDDGNLSERPANRREQLSRRRLHREAERLFEDDGVSYDAEEIEEILQAETPDEPSFPFLILILAILKDVLDALTLTGVGYVISLVVSLIIGAIIFIWILSRGKAPWRKKHVRKSIQRFIIANVADLIPVINILPIETIFVLMVHFEEKKLVGEVRGAFEGLQKFKRFLHR